MSVPPSHPELIVPRLSTLSAHQVQSDSNPQTTLIRVGLIDAKACVRDAVGGAGRQDFSWPESGEVASALRFSKAESRTDSWCEMGKLFPGESEPHKL